MVEVIFSWLTVIFVHFFTRCIYAGSSGLFC